MVLALLRCHHLLLHFELLQHLRYLLWREAAPVVLLDDRPQLCLIGLLARLCAEPLG